MPQNISYSFTADNSFFNTSGPVSINSNQQSQPSPKQKYRSNDDNSETSKVQETEDKIPSDLSIGHYPHRTCDYNPALVNSDEKEGENAYEFESTSVESKWIVDNTCISDLCSTIKNVTLELAKCRDPAKLSDIHLLVLNGIYKFDRNFTSSVSKYFSSKVHTLLKPILSFDAYLPTKGLNCYDWCMDIEVSPPVDWKSSLTLCAKILTKACESKNLLDIHTAHVLTQIRGRIFSSRILDNYLSDFLLRHTAVLQDVGGGL
ncbi:hypothetical protein EDC94DRAFT_608837 [Helicostylum pulchrum]|nr:hypothetical protein EDC94DRAFT_608837 [Helicostylum pulchrum]